VGRSGWLLVAVLTTVAGCARPAGMRHEVAAGENLYRIGKAYGVSHRELARVNGIRNPDRIEVGQVILIPHAERRLPVRVITPARARADRPSTPELPAGPAPFLWPLQGGVISSDFGPRGASHHDGIDIAAVVGAPVRAARAGTVLYSDTLRGYGNVLILEHDAGYATVYAHNRANLARVGDVVRQGDTIASVGATGKASGPNLHFEIRKDNVARNPRFYLPPRPGGDLLHQRADVVEKGP